MNNRELTGDVITPKDPEYNEAKKVFVENAPNAPALIVRAKNVDDVKNAIAYSREKKLVLSVRSGGHSNAGHSTNVDGIVLDMKHFNAVEVLEEDASGDNTNFSGELEAKLVKIGPAAKWIEVSEALRPYGLAISAGDTKTVAVGGLVLGGGIGWLVRKYGLTIDSLKSAEIVTADGRVLTVSETENPDLFWAIRGGGGNFGVLTSVTIQAQKVAKVYSGSITYSLDNFPALLAGWRDFMRSAPRELTTTFMYMPAMMGNPPMVIVLAVYASDNETEATKALEPLFGMGTVLGKDLKLKDYADVLEDAHPPQGMKIIVKNTLIKKMNDDVLAAISEVAGNDGSPFVVIRALGGAMADVHANATAFGYRDSEAMILVPTFMKPDIDEAGIKKAMEPWNSLSKFGRGAYIGFLSERDEDVSGIYPAGTLERLREVKEKWDPENVFSECYCVG